MNPMTGKPEFGPSPLAAALPAFQAMADAFRQFAAALAPALQQAVVTVVGAVRAARANMTAEELAALEQETDQ